MFGSSQSGHHGRHLEWTHWTERVEGETRGPDRAKQLQCIDSTQLMMRHCNLGISKAGFWFLLSLASPRGVDLRYLLCWEYPVSEWRRATSSSLGLWADTWCTSGTQTIGVPVSQKALQVGDVGIQWNTSYITYIYNYIYMYVYIYIYVCIYICIYIVLSFSQRKFPAVYTLTWRPCPSHLGGLKSHGRAWPLGRWAWWSVEFTSRPGFH